MAWSLDGYWPVPWMFGPMFMNAIIAPQIRMSRIMMRGIMGAYRRQSDPVELLKERFARGEITQVEFQEGRRLLEDSRLAAIAAAVMRVTTASERQSASEDDNSFLRLDGGTSNED